MHDLSALALLIEQLGGSEAIKEMFLAIRDVCRWWP